MYIMTPILAIVISISFMLGRKVQDRIVSDLSPFSFAEDMMIICTRACFAVPVSQIDCIHLWYNPKSLKNKVYDMKISIVKVDGSAKNIQYRGSGSKTTPNEIAASLEERNIKYKMGAKAQ